MAAKPTYKELEQRIREFEQGAEKHAEAGGTIDLQTQILSSIKDTIVIITPEMKTVYANQTAKNLFGDRPEMFTEPCYRFFKNRDTVCENCPVLKTIHDQKPHKAVMKSYDKNGEEMWRFNTAFPFYDPDGQVIAGIEIVTDYTPQKMTETALQESEERYRAFFDNMSDGVAIYEARNEGEDFIFVDFNKAGERIEDIHKETLIGRSVLKVFPGIKEFGLFDVFKRVWKTGKPEHHPIAMYKDERIEGWRENFICKLPSGEIVAIYSDETERRQAEEASKKNEEKYRNIFNNAQVGIFRTRLSDGKVLECNDRFARTYGYKNPEECINDFVVSEHYADPSVREKMMDALLEKGKVINLESCFNRKDGDEVWVRFSAHAYPEEGYLEGVGYDITEQKQAEEALRESQEKYRNLVEESFDGIFIQKGPNIIFVNKRLNEMLGYEKGELVGQNHWVVYHPDYQKLTRERAQARMRGEEVMRRYEVKLQRKDGSWFYGELNARPITFPSDKEKGIQVWVKDIMEQKIAEETLRESEEKYRLLVENATDAIFIAQDAVIKFANPKTEDLLGYSAEELAKTSFADFIHPDDRDMVIDMHRRRLAGEDFPNIYSFKITDSNNEELTVELNTVLINWEGRPATLNFLRDITSQKKLEAQLQQAQKMEAIGTLAGGIAHDFNNLLMAIQGRTSIMRMTKDSSHPDFEHLKGVEDHVKSAADLTRQLLGFARGGKYEVRPTNLNELIKEESRMFGRTKKEIIINDKYEENLWSVEIDRGQIGQVLLNLYVNAWQAMPGGGNLYLETENVTIDENYAKPFSIEPGRYVKISVTDTGVGMDKATQKKIFDPFFTTKEMGRGTGLGLASSYGIVKNHGGFINVYSEKGHGTTFNIYLPASAKKIIEEKQPSGDILRGSETVLFVDDEDMIIEVAEELFKELGYKILIARGGKEAIEIYEKNKERIDMVILDMIMPDMSGSVTYDRLKEIDPHIKVLLSSGYSINGQATEIMDRGCDGFIQKPFKIKELSQKLREMLDEK
ncbi:MAG: PAS domain S-box protein [Deltaproteobacteria bacterium]|nr:PAS domain S-box protein [Deltaproteobacteria bacterium]